MTQRRSAKQDRTALTHFLRNAGPVGLRGYIEMLIGTLQARASQTSSPVDDVIIIALRVMFERLFPPEAPQVEPQEPT